MAETGDHRAAQEGLPAEEVRRIAHLARLELSDEQVERYRVQLGSVLESFHVLRGLDLEGVEPMTHVVEVAPPDAGGEAANRLDLDEPRESLPNDALMRMAPEKLQPFLRVPKVLEGQD